MKLNPVIFVLIAYGITAVISVCVMLIVRVIAFAVRPKASASAGDAKPDGKGGAV